MVGVEWGFGVFEHMYSPSLSEGINYRGQRGAIADKQPSETWVTTAHSGTALECCWLVFAGDKYVHVLLPWDQILMRQHLVHKLYNDFSFKESLMVIFRVSQLCTLHSYTHPKKYVLYVHLQYSTVINYKRWINIQIQHSSILNFPVDDVERRRSVSSGDNSLVSWEPIFVYSKGKPGSSWLILKPSIYKTFIIANPHFLLVILSYEMHRFASEGLSL